MISRVLEQITKNDLDHIEVRNFDDNNLVIITNALTHNQKIKTVNIVNCTISEKGANAIANMLKANKNITNFIFNGNIIASSNIATILKALKENKSVTTLNIGNYYYQQNAVEAEQIADLLDSNENITSINVCFKRLDTNGFQAIAKMLSANATLKKMTVSSEDNNASDLNLFANSLKTNQSLSKLRIYIKVNDQNIASFAEAFKVNKKLTSVKFYYTNITDQGAKILADALIVNQTLVEFSLIDSSITDEGIKAMAEMLEVNKNLKSISLDCNKIGKDGTKAIADALMVNTTLESLQLYTFIDNNFIDNNLRRVLIKALRANTTLTHIHPMITESALREETEYLLARNALLKTVANHSLPITGVNEENKFESDWQKFFSSRTHPERQALKQDLQSKLARVHLNKIDRKLDDSTLDNPNPNFTKAAERLTFLSDAEDSDLFPYCISSLELGHYCHHRATSLLKTDPKNAQAFAERSVEYFFNVTKSAEFLKEFGSDLPFLCEITFDQLLENEPNGQMSKSNSLPFNEKIALYKLAFFLKSESEKLTSTKESSLIQFSELNNQPSKDKLLAAINTLQNACLGVEVELTELQTHITTLATSSLKKPITDIMNKYFVAFTVDGKAPDFNDLAKILNVNAFSFTELPLEPTKKTP